VEQAAGVGELKRAAIAIAIAVAVVVGGALFVLPGVAWAHNAGRVELLVTNLRFDRAPDGLAVSADLVDRDSGDTAAGFVIVVTASGAGGASAGPVTMTDQRQAGHYEGLLAVGPGSWTVTARAEQGSSALPALGSSRTTKVEVDEAGAVSSHRSGGDSNVALWVVPGAAAVVLVAGGVLLITRRTGASPLGRRPGLLALLVVAVALAGLAPKAGAQETTTTVPQYGTRPVNITLEVRTDYPDTLPSSLYIPLRARLTDAETGQPVADPYTVRASVRVPGQPSAETYDFAYPHGTVEGAEAGVYHGVVIVPAGGRWTVVANAYNTKEAERERLPRTLGVAEFEVEATGPALQTSQGRRSNDVAGNVNPRAEESEVALLFFHTIVAGAWFALAALLALLGLPNRRRFLAGPLSDLLDRNVRKLTSGLLWSTVLVWGTGLLNLQKTVAFPPPLSSDQATQLFRLPYAKPYTLALYTKIGLYVVLTLAAVALVKEAKRRVAEFDDARFRAERAEAAAAAVPPASVGPAPVAVTAAPAGAIQLTPRRSGTALASRPPAAPSAAAARRVATDVAASAAPGTPARRSFWLGVGSLAIGAAGMVFCVTVLKYVHILSETVRGLQ
jgi:hypothetical protein